MSMSSVGLEGVMGGVRGKWKREAWSDHDTLEDI